MRNCLIVVKYQNGLVKLRQTLIDQGLVYQNERYITSLKEHGIVQSMNRKGNCIDNCVMETFFGRMKTKMFNCHEKEYQTFEEFSEAVDDYIYFYKNQRIQKKTKWMPPVLFRKASICNSVL